jgi:hypothetical protein
VTDTDIAPARRPHSWRGKVKKIVRKTPPPRNRGVPPPLPFDLDALPASTRLAKTETAAAVRRSVACLDNWQQDPDHPLKWRRVGGRILYELGSIREFLNGTTK